MQNGLTLSSSANIFGHHTNQQLIKFTKEREIGNVDYSVYQEFRAVIKNCAIHYFPRLFKTDGDQKKFKIKGKVSLSITKEKINFVQIGESPRALELAKQVEAFLDSVIHFKFVGKTAKSQAIPAFHLDDPYVNYFYSSRKHTREKVIEDYKSKYGVTIDLKAFTCPLSKSVNETHKNENLEQEHIEDEEEIFRKLWAAIYILNKVKRVDPSDYLSKRFYQIKLKFRASAAPEDHKTKKVFLFAQKILFTEILCDTRNLMFICSSCNQRKPKGIGWSEAMEKGTFVNVAKGPLKQEMKARRLQRTHIIDFEITEKFKREIVETFKQLELEQDIENLAAKVAATAKKHGLSVDEVYEKMKKENVDARRAGPSRS